MRRPLRSIVDCWIDILTSDEDFSGKVEFGDDIQKVLLNTSDNAVAEMNSVNTCNWGSRQGRHG